MAEGEGKQGKVETQQTLPVLADLLVEKDETAHLTYNGKKKTSLSTGLTRDEINNLAKNKGKRGLARHGAHLDRVDIGG